MRIKDLYLSMLSESENFFHIDNSSIGKILDVNMSKADDYIKIDFNTTYDKKGSLVAKYTNFSNWYKQHVNEYPDVFKEFAKQYIDASEETRDTNKEEPVNEIIDDDGNIMSSDDKPNNSSNSMVGSKNTWDLEKLYKSLIPSSVRYYNGGLGLGIVTW